MIHIETVFIKEMDDGTKGTLGIGSDNKLYWNKKALLTEQKITLQWWVNLSIVFASIATVVMAITSIFQCLK